MEDENGLEMIVVATSDIEFQPLSNLYTVLRMNVEKIFFSCLQPITIVWWSRMREVCWRNSFREKRLTVEDGRRTACGSALRNGDEFENRTR